MPFCMGFLHHILKISEQWCFRRSDTYTIKVGRQANSMIYSIWQSQSFHVITKWVNKTLELQVLWQKGKHFASCDAYSFNPINRIQQVSKFDFAWQMNWTRPHFLFVFVSFSFFVHSILMDQHFGAFIIYFLASLRNKHK